MRCQPGQVRPLWPSTMSAMSTTAVGSVKPLRRRATHLDERPDHASRRRRRRGPRRVTVEFCELLGSGKADAGFDGSRMSVARLAILPGLRHYTVFSSPALVTT